MDLPIDFRKTKFPIKNKYLDEETESFARWIEFGTHPDGSVDIHWATGGNDIMVAVPEQIARKILKAREDFCHAVLEAVNGEPSA